MTIQEDTIKVLHGVDASRRVGWAKAYSYQEKCDELSRDLNVSMSERDIMRKSLSYMYGFTDTYATAATAGRTQEKLKQIIHGLGAVLDQDVVLVGRRDARQLINDVPPERIANQSINRTRSENLVKRFYSICARRYGFQDWSKMKKHLDDHFKEPYEFKGDKSLTDIELEQIVEIVFSDLEKR